MHNRDQELRALAAPAEDPGRFPAPTLGSSHPPVTPGSGNRTPSSGLCRYFTHVTHTNKQTYAHICK